MTVAQDDDVEQIDPDLLRPETWDDYIGQTQAKAELDVAIAGALERNSMIGHVLLAGRPGVGKTSLAAVVAHQLGEKFHVISCAGLRPNALTHMFRSYPVGVMLFDEIHAASKPIQDMLLTILEDGWMTTPGGQKMCVGSWLTVIGATTEKRRLDPALRSRFEIQPRFVDYTEDEMRRIVAGMAAKLEVGDDTGDLIATIARAAGGTPRNGRHLIRKARDLQAACRRNGDPPPTPTDVLRLAGVDENGVTDEHVDYLKALNKVGGVAGLDTLEMLLTLHRNDIREIELFLLERDMITYTSSGREITSAGVRKLRDVRSKEAA